MSCREDAQDITGQAGQERLPNWDVRTRAVSAPGDWEGRQQDEQPAHWGGESRRPWSRAGRRSVQSRSAASAAWAVAVEAQAVFEAKEPGRLKSVGQSCEQATQSMTMPMTADDDDKGRVG